MNINNQIYVFHVKKPNGSGIFLYPDSEFDKIILSHKSFQLAGRYGSEPVIESLAFLRNSLYSTVEESINNAIMESRFIPRFLGSALVFVIVYFFMSFLIRDPIPLIDELVGGFAAAAIFYIAKGRKYKKSDEASKLKFFYKGMVDNIAFSQSDFVLATESLLSEIDSKTIEEIAAKASSFQQISAVTKQEFADEKNQFLGYVEKKLKKNLNAAQKNILNKIILTGIEKNFQLLKNLNLIDVTAEIDINIFVAYILLKQSRQQNFNY